jgi:hypothetical protein
MFARGIDFERDENKDVVLRLASSLNITRTGGNGVVISSKIITPSQADREAANRANNCPEPGLAGINPSGGGWDRTLRSSHFGTPDPSLINADGNITSTDYLTQGSAVATGFASELTSAGMQEGRGDIAYMVKGYFSLPALQFLGFAPNGAYCRYIF